MLFNTWGWHIKNKETSESFQYWMIWLHQWRMPLLLFISGAGTYMALGKRTPAQYTAERFKRLFIPLVFGMFVVVPPQIYFEHISEYSNYADFHKTVFEFVPYPKGSFSWHHLWFICYLLFYSILALPLLVYLRSDRSIEFRRYVAKVLTTPTGILVVPVAFLMITQIILRPYFPDETHALIDDWAFFVFYFSFFLFGILCYSNQEIWESVGRNRNFLLVSTLFILIPFYVTYFHFRGLVHLPWSDEIVDVIFAVISTWVAWFCVITVIAYGQHYLNIYHPFLKHVNEGLYPFYILHQTAIIVIGFYVCQLDWSIGAKFWSVSFLTLTSCLAFYFVVIRPFNFMRLLFGMKPRQRNAEHSKRIN